MSRYAVSLPALEELVACMQAFERTMAQRVADADAIATTLGATWSGEAAASFAAAHRGCLRDLEAMQALAARLRAQTATAHGNYRSAVVANRRMWG